jgi:signal transduction histidine kinase
MKWAYLFFFCLWAGIAIPCLSQTDIQSLESRLKGASQPEKVKLLNQLAELYLKSSPDQTIEYSTQALIIIRQLLEDGVKISHHRLSLHNEQKQPIHIEGEEVTAYSNIGKAYYAKGQYSKAIKQFKSSLEISERIRDEEGRKHALENLVIIDETLKADKAEAKVKWDRILRDKLESLRIGKRVGEATQHLSLATLEKIAIIHEKKQNYNSAIDFHLKTVPVYEAANNKQKVAGKLNHIADLYKEIGNYKDALRYYDLAMQTKEALGDSLGVTHSLDSVKAIYQDLEAFNRTLRKPVITSRENAPADKLSETTKPVVAKESNYKELAENFEEKGDYKKSLEYFKLYVDLKDKLTTEERSRQLEQLQAEYLLTNKSREIELLQKQKQIQQLDLNQKELELTRQRTFKNSLIGGLIFILALAFMFYRQFRIKRKAHRQLEAAYKELKNTHKQLQSAQMQLVQAEKMASLGQLTAGIAHEINNPINFVSANIEPLKNDVADVLQVLHRYEELIEDKGLKAHFEAVDKLKDDLELDYIRSEIDALLKGIEEGAVRTKEIVKGLRIFSRMDENDIKQFNVHEGLDSTLTLLKSKLGDRVEVVKNYGSLPLIEGFPGKINQVFMNILTNAVHAIPAEGKIIITTSIQNDFARISIRDTGIGMTPEVKSRIFEPFFTTKDVGEGTGLGLAISFGVIEQHKGKIAVESEPGRGTEFIIILPLKQ